MSSSTPEAAQGERRRRVPAMAPEDRRAALVAATVPLLHAHGLDISTRQIAQAAGVAEGTIFGVFRDKNSLLVTALLHALDPQPTLDAMAAIDRGAPLRERLVSATELINQRFAGNAHLTAAARRLALAGDTDPEVAQQMMRARHDLHETLTELIAPDAGRLRRSPAMVARLVLLFCGANAFGPFGDREHVDADEMVSLVLDGLLNPQAHKHGGA